LKSKKSGVSTAGGMWCPICGSKLSEKELLGVKVLWCPRHKEMKVYLDRDPLAAAAAVEACDFASCRCGGCLDV